MMVSRKLTANARPPSKAHHYYTSSERTERLPSGCICVTYHHVRSLLGNLSVPVFTNCCEAKMNVAGSLAWPLNPGIHHFTIFVITLTKTLTT